MIADVTRVPLLAGDPDAKVLPPEVDALSAARQ